MSNEILQWICIILLAAPKAVQVVRDFKEEEDE
jgi:hypothetical protein